MREAALRRLMKDLKIMRPPSFLFTSDVLLATSGLGLSAQAKESRPNIEVSSMMRYCQGEVAAKERVMVEDQQAIAPA